MTIHRYILTQSLNDPEVFFICRKDARLGYKCLQYESGSLRWLIEDLNEDLPSSTCPSDGRSDEDKSPALPYEDSGSEGIAVPSREACPRCGDPAK
jgi:hypothetical protein